MKRIRDLKHRSLRILARIAVTLACIILCITLVAVIFMTFWTPLGAKASVARSENYAMRAENYSGGAFHNPGEFSIMSEGYTDSYAEHAGSKGPVPQDTLPTVNPSFSSAENNEEFTVTWFGHSTVFLQMGGFNIMFDPVLSDIASPVSFIGSRRYSPLAVTAEELPELDAVIITHDHYDHLDYPTIRALKDKTKRFIVGLGVENHLERFGVDSDSITALAWWEETSLGDITVACTPAHHYSGRSLNDRNASLWTSWVLIGEGIKVYESGDTGYGDHFAEIYEKYGEFDLAMLDCAQYNERWHAVHMFPEESVRAGADLHATTLMPIHWGAFRLSSHAWDDPPERFTQQALSQNFEVLTPKLGQTVNWDNRAGATVRWWREYK